MFASLTFFSGMDIMLVAPLANESFARIPSMPANAGEENRMLLSWRPEEINMPKRVYYHATGPKSFEWVDSPEKATQEDKQAAEVTQRQLKDTELVEVPPKRQHQHSKWVICRNAG
jgi:hypothetical protein